MGCRYRSREADYISYERRVNQLRRDRDEHDSEQNQCRDRKAQREKVCHDYNQQSEGVVYKLL